MISQRKYTPEEIQQIQEDNILTEVADIDKSLMKDLYVFRMAMARIRMPGARQTAINAATRVLNYLDERVS